jgi:hypothetical protein
MCSRLLSDFLSWKLFEIFTHKYWYTVLRKQDQWDLHILRYLLQDIDLTNCGVS